MYCYAFWVRKVTNLPASESKRQQMDCYFDKEGGAQTNFPKLPVRSVKQ